MIGDIFNAVFIIPTLNALIGLYKVFEAIGAPIPLGLAIIAFTALLRVLLWPVTMGQLKSAKKMSELNPKIAELKKQYGHDKALHQKKQAELFKEHGVNPASGCLQLVVQLVVLISIYQALSKVIFIKDVSEFVASVNKVLYHPALHLSGPLNDSFFGWSLKTKPAEWPGAGLIILLVPILTVALQLVQSKMMVLPQKKVVSPQAKVEKEDFAKSMSEAQKQMTYILPFMTGFFVYLYPLGLALYWNTFTFFGILQQYKVSGWGSLSEWLPKRRT